MPNISSHVHVTLRKCTFLVSGPGSDHGKLLKFRLRKRPLGSQKRHPWDQNGERFSIWFGIPPLWSVSNPNCRSSLGNPSKKKCPPVISWFIHDYTCLYSHLTSVQTLVINQLSYGATEEPALKPWTVSTFEGKAWLGSPVTACFVSREGQLGQFQCGKWCSTITLPPFLVILVGKIMTNHGEKQGRVAGFVLPTTCGITSVCRS
jgi:hypothetical protein